jgi:Co/Zn/Cd efflux system component
MSNAHQHDEGLRRVVWLVAVFNLTYFGVEFSIALAIDSVSLCADSIDFLEDASTSYSSRVLLPFGQHG